MSSQQAPGQLVSERAASRRDAQAAECTCNEFREWQSDAFIEVLPHLLRDLRQDLRRVSLPRSRAPGRAACSVRAPRLSRLRSGFRATKSSRTPSLRLNSRNWPRIQRAACNPPSAKAAFRIDEHRFELHAALHGKQVPIRAEDAFLLPDVRTATRSPELASRQGRACRGVDLTPDSRTQRSGPVRAPEDRTGSAGRCSSSSWAWWRRCCSWLPSPCPRSRGARPGKPSPA